jgi:hypothetical protein
MVHTNGVDETCRSFIYGPLGGKEEQVWGCRSEVHGDEINPEINQ